MANDCIPLPKGSYAIAHKQTRAYTLHTGVYHYSRFYVVKVESASREGRVKTFRDCSYSAPKRMDSSVTIYSLPEQYLNAAELLFAKQALAFTGYADKEHLRLALVNVEIEAAA